MPAAELPEYEVRYALSDREIRDALALETEVFREEHFLPVEHLYEPYLPQSTLIGAFTKDACVGVCRMVDGDPLPPPMFDDEHFVISLEPDRWKQLGHSGLLNEWATIAVAKSVRNTHLMIDLCRFCYRDARHLTDRDFGSSDVKRYTSIILHPGDAWGLRMKWHLTIDQIGPEQHYMEGTEFREEIVTAPYVTDWTVFEERLAAASPDYWAWMHDADLDEHVPPPTKLFRRSDPMIAPWNPIQLVSEN